MGLYSPTYTFIFSLFHLHLLCPFPHICHSLLLSLPLQPSTVVSSFRLRPSSSLTFHLPSSTFFPHPQSPFLNLPPSSSPTISLPPSPSSPFHTPPFPSSTFLPHPPSLFLNLPPSPSISLPHPSSVFFPPQSPSPFLALHLPPSPSISLTLPHPSSLLPLRPPPTPPLPLQTFSPDGRWLISSAMDCSIRTWDLPTGRYVDLFSLFQLIPRNVAAPASLNQAILL